MWLPTEHGGQKRIFVTGTDTDVGKSVVGASLAAGVVAHGFSVAALKPLASGVPHGQVGEDARILGVGAGHAPRVWLTFEPPVSPHRAAEQAGWRGSPEAMCSWIDGHDEQVLVVEAAGGWGVPLLPRSDGSLFEVPDLAHHVGGSIVVVAADRLGVLSHTRLTVRAIQQDGLSVAAVVLNRGFLTDADPSQDSNGADLDRLLDVPVVRFPRLSELTHASLTRAGVNLLSDLPKQPPGS